MGGDDGGVLFFLCDKKGDFVYVVVEDGFPVVSIRTGLLCTEFVLVVGGEPVISPFYFVVEVGFVITLQDGERKAIFEFLSSKILN